MPLQDLPDVLCPAFVRRSVSTNKSSYFAFLKEYLLQSYYPAFRSDHYFGDWFLFYPISKSYPLNNFVFSYNETVANK